MAKILIVDSGNVGGVHQPKTFLDPQTPSPTGGAKSSYAYPDMVYAELRFRMLLQYPK